MSQEINLRNFVNFGEESDKPLGLFALPAGGSDFLSTLRNLKEKVAMEKSFFKLQANREMEETVEGLVDDIPNFQNIQFQNLYYQNSKSYLIKNQIFVDSLKRMSNQIATQNVMHQIRCITSDILHFYRSIDEYKKASRLFDIKTIKLLNIEDEINKYWKNYFEPSNLFRSKEKFVQSNHLILKPGDFDSTLSDILCFAIQNLFVEQNTDDHQIALFNLLTYVKNKQVIANEIKNIYNMRIRGNEDVYLKENYIFADFFSMLYDFEKILPVPTKSLLDLLHNLIQQYKGFVENMPRKFYIYNLELIERCRIIEKSKFPLTVQIMNSYMNEKYGTVNDTNPISSLIKELFKRQRYNYAEFNDYLANYCYDFLICKVKKLYPDLDFYLETVIQDNSNQIPTEDDIKAAISYLETKLIGPELAEKRSKLVEIKHELYDKFI